jgi:hypothetical protein
MLDLELDKPAFVMSQALPLVLPSCMRSIYGLNWQPTAATSP